ncbi:MAG: sulfurtransferase TusA family protein [bacterium]
MTEDVTGAERKIDLRGEVCPYTFIKSKLAIEEMEHGQVLEITVNHLPAVENVPRSMENEGHEVLSVRRDNDTDWKITVRKNQPAGS